MKPTKLGVIRPLIGVASIGGSSTGSGGTVPTSTGSNGQVEWGPNVARISVNGTTNVLGPFINIANGSNTTVTVDQFPGSAASNTIRIHATGGGGGGVTVSDEGSPLSTTATTLDFVGAGVTASGTGATKTITIPGGGGHGWFDVTAYGAVGDGSTDDTAAIQAAIDACHAAGGGTVFFPEGIYQLDGALQDTGTYNSQLEIPNTPLNHSTGGVVIRFLGDTSPGPNNNVNGGSVLRSSWNGSISGTPSIISAGTHDDLEGSYVYVTFEYLEIRAHENPKLTALDMTATVGIQWHELTISVDRSAAFSVPTSWTVPTNANAIGVDMPWGYNDQPWSGGGNLYVSGFYTGVRPSEQCNADLISASFCARGVEFRGQVGPSAHLRHACNIQRLETFWTVRPIVFSGDERWVNISSLDIEHSLTPFETVYDIDDASNYGRGFMSWHTTDWTDGPEDNLLVNGGSGLSLHGGYAKRWKLNNVVDIPTGTNPATNPATGRRLYADSGTGALTVRKPDGTTVNLEAGGSLAIDDLTDVTITSATTGDMLRFDGSAWVNTPGRWEVVVSGSGPPVAVSTPSDDDWVYAWVSS